MVYFDDLLAAEFGSAVNELAREFRAQYELPAIYQLGPVWVRGRLQLGPLTVEFAYMDTVQAAGLVIEFIAWRIRGRTIKPAAGTIKDVRRLEKWLKR